MSKREPKNQPSRARAILYSIAGLFCVLGLASPAPRSVQN
jgi:hypothetical protein